MLTLLGLALCVIGGLWIVVNAFRESVLWGIGALLLTPVTLIFAIMHFDANKIPLLLTVVGVVLVVIGFPNYAEHAAELQATGQIPQS